ncbi:MAG: Mut7-C RNAse domain-containing protein [Candidatus Thermoplasmatota archaeon]|jgi:hypothetical protein|nr:Mut7-C RNAse domain-containing protein [Candidatus Thermoplasmatota archaeon]MCL5790803.1 Mut7-C RNAse domain-containing protein [Candidatus Thermoplasmatota archaeon]
MLGRLARYLRILGFSVIYESDGIDDREIMRICRAGSYILITRDRNLSQRFHPSVLIKSTEIGEQILEFTKIYHPDRFLAFSRCTTCNGILVPASLDENDYRSHMNPHVCNNCGQLYWAGTHTSRIMEYLEKIGVWNED